MKLTKKKKNFLRIIWNIIAQSLHKLGPYNWIPYNLDYRGYKGRGKRFVEDRDSFIEVDKCRPTSPFPWTNVPKRSKSRRGFSTKIGDKICLTGEKVNWEILPDSEGNFGPSELDSVGDDRWGWVTRKTQGLIIDITAQNVVAKILTIRDDQRKQSCFNSMLLELINCDRSIMAELRINIIRNFNLINLSAWLVLICAVII